MYTGMQHFHTSDHSTGMHNEYTLEHWDASHQCAL